MTGRATVPDSQPPYVVLKNQKILLVRRPNGMPRPTDFKLEVKDLMVPSIYFCPRRNATTNTETNSNREHEPASETTTDLVLETLYVSIDPAMRGWMSAAKSYLPPVKLGSVMRASTICKVVASSHGSHRLSHDFPMGCIVKTEIVGVQSYCVLKGCTVRKARKLLTRLDHHLPSPTSSSWTRKLSYASFLGVLGTTGLTAYFGFLRVGKPKPTDVVLVSGAAGATGSIVCQLAKHVVGCRTVIGTAGSDAKCQWLLDNGIVDVAINYKKARPSLSKAIARECGKEGADLVFDNVGSTFLEAALSNLARGAKIVLCGAISQYNATAASAAGIAGPRNYMNLLVKRATMTGFVVLDYQREFPTAISELVGWIAARKIVCYQEDLRHVGISRFYPALLSLFEGTNIGKVVLKAKPSGETPGETKDSPTPVLRSIL